MKRMIYLKIIDNYSQYTMSKLNKNYDFKNPFRDFIGGR